jgi:hypothetical protein
MASSPGHALWRSVLDWLLDFYRKGNHLTIKSVIRSTGPGMFSDAVKAYLKNEFGAVLGEEPLTIKQLGQKNLHVGDVLVLKQSAFASGSGDTDPAEALVRHAFAGSWKTVVADKTNELDSLAGQHAHETARLREEMLASMHDLKEENQRLKNELEKAQRVKEKTDLREQATNAKKERKKTMLPSEGDSGEIKKALSVPVAAKWGRKEKDWAKMAEVDDSADRKKFLMQRLAQKAAAHVESADIDKIEEHESQIEKEGAPKREEVLQPHRARKKKKPFNHGSD